MQTREMLVKFCEEKIAISEQQGAAATVIVILHKDAPEFITHLADHGGAPRINLAYAGPDEPSCVEKLTCVALMHALLLKVDGMPHAKTVAAVVREWCVAFFGALERRF